MEDDSNWDMLMAVVKFFFLAMASEGCLSKVKFEFYIKPKLKGNVIKL